ncbi:MAG: leucine-rich repeat domain-containing protein, partial [Lachnospiraceae bacterium]|nr:leucine-rich repeat domain-containing protein [Lachnospiraceae bacterium]
MRTVKILLALLFFAMLAGVAMPNSSQAAKKGDYKYIIYEGRAVITGYTGKDKTVRIPDMIAGKKVARIESIAFIHNKSIKKVTIPDTVESIGIAAFEGCSNLSEVKLSKKLKKIERDAFTETGLRQIKLPDSVKFISNYAFYSCKKLKKVHLGKNLKKIRIGCFSGCTKLSSINLEHVEEIGAYAFRSDKSIRGVLNLSSVTTIGEEAFYGCAGIKEVHLSANLQRLGKDEYNPFAYCTGIEKFAIPKKNGNYMCVDGVIYGKTGDSLVAWPARKAEAVVLGSNIRKIYGHAFSGARITSIAMEGKVNYIGNEAFAESMITHATLPLPDTSEKIWWGHDAFRGCSKLVKAVFPEQSVSSNKIGFLYCTSLREVVLPETMTELSGEMFLGCTALESITIPKPVTRIPVACFYKCSRLKNVNLENIAEIGAAAFGYCSSLTGTLSLNAQKIGVLSFEKCTNIAEVKFNKPLSKVLSESYTVNNNLITDLDDDVPELFDDTDISSGSLQSNPFAGCTSLTSVTVPEGSELRNVDGVLYSADMTELVAFPASLSGRFIVPQGVVNICSYAFEDSAITELVTTDSVQNIYYHAVNGSSIKSVTIEKNVKYIEERALDGCMQLESINVHASNKKYESEDGVLYEKKAKGSLLLYPPARKGAKYTVRKKAGLESFSFNNCKYLKKVIMPEGIVEDIAKPFYNCKNIKLYFPKSMKTYN